MKIVSRATKALARRVGVDLRRHNPWASAAARRQQLLADGRFDVVLDVGANAGQTGRELRAHGYRGRIVSFEPLRDAFERLEAAAAGDPDWECRRLALGERSGTMPILVATNEGASSSFLPFSAAHQSSAPGVALAGSEVAEIARLDDVAEEVLGASARPWLKLDVQGYELHALQGAEATLPRIEAIEVELSLVELYEGQPVFDEMLRFLQDAGFRTADVSTEFVHPETGRMLQVNLLGLRQGAEAQGF